jgi:hypothetical protein
LSATAMAGIARASKEMPLMRGTTPQALPSPNQKVKVLHLEESATQGRGLIDGCFQVNSAQRHQCHWPERARLSLRPQPLHGPHYCHCQVWVAASHSPKPCPKSTTVSRQSHRSLPAWAPTDTAHVLQHPSSTQAAAATPKVLNPGRQDTNPGAPPLSPWTAAAGATPGQHGASR